MTDAMISALWASMPVPAIVLAPDDTIARVNPEAEAFLTASAKSLAGMPILDRLVIDAPIAEAIGRVRDKGSPLFVNRVDVASAARAAESCNIQMAPLADHPGHVLLMITPRQLVGRLSRAGASRSSARSAIGMSEMLAHEIKNPLAGITGAAQLLSMSLSAQDRELTDLIVAESRRIVTLLEQVEQFGNLRPPRKTAVNIHDVLDRARRTAILGFAAHMRLLDDYDPSLPPTSADGDQLLQVVLNLMRNATEAAGVAGGTIRLRTFYDHALRLRRADGTNAALPLQIEIIDDGPGLPPDLTESIFDPFVSGRENGTGLGLALVSKIVGEHDGLITADSVPGRTVFRISLPIHVPPTEED